MEKIQSEITQITKERQRPLCIPNLPHSPVRLCLSSVGPASVSRLRAAGVAVLSPLAGQLLPVEERRHADLLFCHASEKAIILAPSQHKLSPLLQTLGFSPIFSAEPQATYPANIGLSFALCGRLAVGNFRFCDPALLPLLQNNGKKMISVRQGYAKCAVCIITETAAITEDAGVARALEENGVDVLQIAAGDVYLSEKHYGFFGGAAGKIAPDVLAVNGSLQTHRDGARIINHLRKYNVRPLELHSGKITDVGGILPLTEKGDEPLVLSGI